MTRKVLIVDDDADMRLTLKLALELAGYQVAEAANGRQALEQQRAAPADVVITDIFMPESDGFEAIDGLRRQFPATKVIVMSGGAQLTKRDYLPDAELMGADATLQKPFDIDELLKTLQRLDQPATR
jgi:CheY-like chemotaxis protein